MSAGHELDLAPKKYAGDEQIPVAAMRRWGEARTVRASVIRDLLLGRLGADRDPHGIRLRGARIAGRLDLEYLVSTAPLSLRCCLLPEGIVASGASLPALILRGSCLEHPDLPALAADRLATPILDLCLSTVTASTESSGVLLAGCELGTLRADGAVLENQWGPAIDASECHVARDASFARFDEGDLTRKFSAKGRGDNGAIRLWGAKIDGSLRCSGSVTNASGPALDADGLAAGLSVLLVVLEAEGDGSGGAVRLRSAQISGSLSLAFARLTNDTGPALVGDGLDVDQDVSLAKTEASGWGPSGAVRLLGGHIGGLLQCGGAVLTNERGPALGADGLVVDQDIFLHENFAATGSGDRGALSLAGARVGGQLVLADATVTSADGPAISTDGLTVGQDLYLMRVTLTGGGEQAVLDLQKTQVARTFAYRPAKVTNTSTASHQVNVDGLTYGALPAGLTPAEWLRVIRSGTPAYAAQPYQYLAAGLSAAGDDSEARDVLIAQRQDQLDRRALTGTGPRAWARFTGLVLGYGYRPSRALVFLLGVLVISVLLAILLGGHGALAQTNPAGTAVLATPCTTVQRMAVGLNLGEPFVSADAHCETTASAAGDWLTVSRWLLQVTAWALATLFVAGFTSAVRKT